MTYVLYNVATDLAAPLGLVYLALSGKHRPLLSRVWPRVPTLADRPIWVQACSVGEVGVARPFIRALAERFPGVPVLLTVSTLTGYRLAQGRAGDACVAWCPFDHRLSVRRFLRRASPRALVLIETEVWPNLLREARRAGVPTVIVNGRISDKHFARYIRLRPLIAPAFRLITAAGMQNDVYADRIARLGVAGSAIHVTGNTKFDGVVLEPEPGLRERVRAEHGFAPDAPVLVFGSTRPGDEALAAQCRRILRDEIPGLRLVVAPRHMKRVEEVLAAFEGPVVRRSAVKAGQEKARDGVLVIDTLGELIDFYAVATVAVVGGSFYAGVNGHNPLEPAALGVPTVFGPFMRNFAEPAQVLLESGGAVQVSRPDDLVGALRELLTDPRARENVGRRGREVVLARRGATGRNVELLASVLEGRHTHHG